MRPEEPRSAADANTEISALIEVLHQTGQRLEELTAGEVDAVADRQGRPFVLRQAQEQLRQSEAARQAAILNALPANIALLDTRSVVVSVNAAWREFASANAFHGAEPGMGRNYLEICDRAQGADAEQARSVAAGLRALLAGERASYSIEYPCHSPTEQRWFLMVATPLPGPRPNGIVVMHVNITQRIQAEQDLRESERRFTAMLENVELVSVMLDREARITYCNDYLLRLSGWSLPDVIGRNWFELFVPPDASVSQDAFLARLANQPITWHHENELLTRTGERRLIRWNNSVLRSGAGDFIGTASIGEDISERRNAEAKIERLNRVYAMVSGIHTLIVRVRERDELFREACRIAVDAGAFKMAWIGVLEPPSLDGRVVAWYGCEQDFIDQIKLTVRDDAGDDERPACRALRLGQPVICNDIATEPSLAALKDELLGRGYQALGSFPLTVAGQSEAVFALFAGESGFFDEEETALLVELAANLSFAMGNLERENRLAQLDAQRTLDEEELRRFSSAMDATADAIYLVDRASMRFIHVNDAACRMQRQTREQLLALGPVALLSTSRAELELTYDALIASGTNAAPLELLRQRQDGSQAWVELRRHALRSGVGWTIVTLVRDITERKQAQVTLAEQMAELRRWSDVTEGREGRVLEIKQEVNELLMQAGRPARYASAKS